MLRLWRYAIDRRGASMVEFALVAFFLFALTSGIIEFSFFLYQLNSASKALQVGARLASVSNPVANELGSVTLVDVDNNLLPGDPVPYFKIICSGESSQCTGCVSGDPVGCFDSDALNAIVYGRGDAAQGCGNARSLSAAGMCDIFYAIRPANVIITYEQTGLGFIGRPGGPVPTITVELTGISFGFVFLSGLLNITSLPLSPLRTTATGEDLSITAPP